MWWWRHPPTPLEQYATSLPDAAVTWAKCWCYGAKVTPMFFPMYTVEAEVVLSMTKVEPHEMLKASQEKEFRSNPWELE